MTFLKKAYIEYEVYVQESTAEEVVNNVCVCI